MSNGIDKIQFHRFAPPRYFEKSMTQWKELGVNKQSNFPVQSMMMEGDEPEEE